VNDGVLTCTTAGVPDDVRITFAEPSEFCRIQTGVHASQNRKVPNGRESKFTLAAEICRVGRIGQQHFLQNITHRLISNKGTEGRKELNRRKQREFEQKLAKEAKSAALWYAMKSQTRLIPVLYL
jgi:hypothetical protein